MLKTTCLDKDGNTIYHLTQWDVNQSLRIDMEDYIVGSSAKVHFCNKNSEKALVVSATVSNNIVSANIPNELLREPYPLIAYIYMTDSENTTSKKTVAFIKIPVRERLQPNDYDYSDSIDVIYLDDKIDEVNLIIDDINGLDIETKIAQVQSLLTQYGNMVATLDEVKGYIG